MVVLFHRGKMNNNGYGDGREDHQKLEEQYDRGLNVLISGFLVKNEKTYLPG